MMLRYVFSILLLFSLLSCGGQRPQAELTIFGPLDEERKQDIAKRGVFATNAEKEKLKEANTADIARILGVRVLGKSQTEATMGFGFVGNSNNIYQVLRTGEAAIFPTFGQVIELGFASPRIDEVVLGGPKDRRILGLNNNGSHMSWNAGNLSQQLIIQPQRTTFGLKRSFAAVPTKNSNHLVVASEGGLLQKWSLSSGRLMQVYKFKGDQPRELLHDTLNQDVIYGTMRGQVGVWHKGHVHTEYSHKGPVLEISANNSQSIIMSSAKDGSVIVFDRKAGKILKQDQFSSAVYKAKLHCNGRIAVAMAVNNSPVIHDLKTGKTVTLRQYASDNIRKALPLCDRNEMLFLTRSGRLDRYSIDLGFARGVIKPKDGSGVRDFDYHPYSKNLLLQSRNNRIEYWSLRTLRIKATLIQSDTHMVTTKISPDGRSAVTHLASGQLMHYKITDASPNMFRFGE